MRLWPAIALLALGCGHVDDEARVAPPGAATLPEDAGVSLGVDASSDLGADEPPLPPTSIACAGVAPRITSTITLAHAYAVGAPSWVKLADGRYMVAHGEQATAGGPIAVLAQIVDPATGAIVSTTRLDDPARGGGFDVSLRATPSGAVVATYPLHAFAGVDHGDTRVYRNGVWSPPLSDLYWPWLDYHYVAEGVDGTIVVHRGAPTIAGTNDDLVLWSPTTGWSAKDETLLYHLGRTDNEYPTSTIRLLRDGSLIEGLNDLWERNETIHVRERDAHGVWSSADPTPVPIDDTYAELFVLDDGSVISLSRTLVTSNGITHAHWNFSPWHAGKGWEPSQILTEGVDGAPRLEIGFGSGGTSHVSSKDGRSIEYLAWVSDCAVPSPTCTFQPIRRVFHDGAWSAPEDLSFGTASALDRDTLVEGDAQTLLVRETTGATEIRGVSSGAVTPAVHVDGPALAVIPGRFGAWLTNGGDTPDDPARVAYVDLLGGKIGAWTTLPSTLYPPSKTGRFSGALFEDPLGGLLVVARDASSEIVTLRVAEGSVESVERFVLGSTDCCVDFLRPKSAASIAGVFVYGAELRTHLWNAYGESELTIAPASKKAVLVDSRMEGCGVAFLDREDPGTSGLAAFQTIVMTIVGG